MHISHHIIEIDTISGVTVNDITPRIEAFVAQQHMDNGLVIVSSRHTTTALAINEYEERLMLDIKKFLERLIPKETKYLHNDIHLRDCPPDEPKNAHSHIAAMLLSSSEVIPVSARHLALGKWQSVLFFELDGPRSRTINVQIIGE